MSLLAKNIVPTFRVHLNMKYSTVANKLRLTPTYNYKTIRIFQCEFVNNDKLRNSLNTYTYFKMYSTSDYFHELKSKLYNVFSGALSFTGKPQDIRLGINWYLTMDRLNFDEFHKLLMLPDTFYSWFKITELHVWMMLVKLMNEGENLKWIREGVVTAMWEDAEKRARLTSPLNKNHRSDFKILFNRFRASLFIYDTGLLSNDMEFATVLWWHFFDKKCDDPRMLEALVNYCRNQVPHLMKIKMKSEGLPENVQVWLPLRHYFQVSSSQNKI